MLRTGSASTGSRSNCPTANTACWRSLVGRLGQVVGKDEIGNGLFGFDDEAGPNAIELYVGRLRKKLAGAPLRITTVRGVGYLLEASDASADADG